MKSAINALRACQPYTMLPADRYGEWKALDLIFTPFEMLAGGLAVAIFAYLVMDGETNWYEGIQLLAVYAIIAVALYFLPPGAAAH